MWELIDGIAHKIDGLPMADRGFLLGDGVFETFRVSDGKIRHSDLHARSLNEACHALGLDCVDWPGVEAVIAGLFDSGNARVGKLIVTRGAGSRGLSPIIDPAKRIFLQDFAAPSTPKVAQLMTVSIRRSATSLAARHKTLSYVDNLAARREAVGRGGSMAVLLTESGFVSGCDSANIFWQAEGQVFTPSLSCGIRNGVMRRRVLHWLEAAGQSVRECEGGLDTLLAASAVWVTNAVTGVTPVSKIDTHRFQTDDTFLQRLCAADL
jgi:aminodeoxychorismate lyase